MQDIDFDALDQEVNKIMQQNQATVVKNKKPVINHNPVGRVVRKTTGGGRNMDIVSPTTKVGAGLVKPNQARLKKLAQINQTAKKQRQFQDIRPKQLATTQKSLPKSTNQPKTASSNPKQMTTATKPVSSAEVVTNQSIGAQRLRQRRRLNGSSAVSASKALTFKPAEAIIPSKAVTKGSLETETLSTKKPDGSETVYSHSRLEYVTSGNSVIAPSPTLKNNNTQSKSYSSLSQYNMVNLDDRAEAKIVQTKSVPVPLESATKVLTTPPKQSVYRLHPSEPHREPAGSSTPFIETAKIKKRPLGVPYHKADLAYVNQSASLELNQEAIEDEAVLYRGDLKIEDEKSSRLSSVIWIVLTILAIIGAAVGIYLMTVYNK